MTSIYSIYAASRTKDGRYQFTDSRPIYRKDFESLDAMREYWDANIRPKSSTQSGKAFELAMVVQKSLKWGHHGEPRYADKPLLNENFRV